MLYRACVLPFGQSNEGQLRLPFFSLGSDEIEIYPKYERYGACEFRPVSRDQNVLVQDSSPSACAFSDGPQVAGRAGFRPAEAVGG